MTHPKNVYLFMDTAKMVISCWTPDALFIVSGENREKKSIESTKMPLNTVLLLPASALFSIFSSLFFSLLSKPRRPPMAEGGVTVSERDNRRKRGYTPGGAATG